jgi:hypothetical protein
MPCADLDYFFTDFGAGFVGFMDPQKDNAVYAFGSVPVNGIGPVGLMIAEDGATARTDATSDCAVRCPVTRKRDCQPPRHR